MINHKILLSIITAILFTVHAHANDNQSENNQDQSFDVATMEVVEYEEELDLGFNPYYYLPHDFDPRVGMPFDINQIIIDEQEEELDLGFDTQKYLPKDFNPYIGM